MIIVLLLFFTSLCVYCRSLVLHVHDRWINPKNSRLLTEAAETSSATTRKLLLEQYHTGNQVSKKQIRKRNNLNSYDADEHAGGILAEACRFCANSPQGYCRHHFHLQELELQKAQKRLQQQTQVQTQNRPRFWQSRFWESLCCGGSNITDWEHTTWAQRRQQRKENRELRRNLKNRLNAATKTTTLQYQQHTILQQHPMQKQFQLQRQFLRRQQYEEELMRVRRNIDNNSNSSISSSSSGSSLWDTSTSNSSSGHQSPFAAVYNVNDSLSDLDTFDSGLATSIESMAFHCAEEQETIEEISEVFAEDVTTASTITTTYL